MKKFSIIALVLSVVLLTACEGDDPSGPGGTLAVVTGLTIEATSAGQNIVLSWTTYSGSETIDGYEVYFRAEDTGNWTALGTTTTTGYDHVATVAGGYSVRAYEGDNYSSEYATSVNTMPITATGGPYTIYDNYAPADYHSGIIFDTNGAQTGLASQAGFVQDIYAYDESKGDDDVWFYSGSFGTFGNGNPTWMYAPGTEYGYCPVYTSGASGWWNNGQLFASDEVIFAHLFDGYYIKIYIEDVFPEPISDNGTGVELNYEFQSLQGVTVFTDDH